MQTWTFHHKKHNVRLFNNVFKDGTNNVNRWNASVKDFTDTISNVFRVPQNGDKYCILFMLSGRLSLECSLNTGFLLYQLG